MKGALIAAALAGAAPPAPAPCLTTPEAEAVAAVALPEMLHEAGLVCAAALPASAMLRQDGGPLRQRYAAEADRRWPAARTALARLADPAVAPLLQSDFARPLLVTLLVPQIVGRIAPADCGRIERLVTLLAPLPPRNTAGVIVAGLAWLRTAKAANVPELPLCPESAR